MTNRLLLGCGIVGGPLFITSSLGQASVRQGFSLSRHHLSTLSLGDYGWVQIGTFIITGLLMIAFAAGLWRIFRFGAGCFGLYGVAMILGGVFLDAPAFGFPAGTPQTASPHAWVHAIGAVGAFLAQVMACMAFAWRFSRDRRKAWAVTNSAKAKPEGA